MSEKLQQVVIFPGEDGFHVAACPNLPGCVSQGETRAEAIATVCEAIEAYIAAPEEARLTLPSVWPG